MAFPPLKGVATAGLWIINTIRQGGGGQVQAVPANLLMNHDKNRCQASRSLAV